jgi:preprotein translocase subunit SecD
MMGLVLTSRLGRLVGFLSLSVLASGCGGGPTLSSSSSHSTTFEIRSVLSSEIGRNAMSTIPFTKGSIKATDPFRQNPGFAEAPPNTARDLVTYEDRNGDGFYTPGTDVKFELGRERVTGANISSATAVGVGNGSTVVSWLVDLTLDAAGTQNLRELTTALVGKQMAIVLDGLVVSTPTVQSPITVGSVQITASFTERRAKEVAGALQPG